MKIKKTFVSFTGKINPGMYAFFIVLDEYSADTNIDDIVKKIVHFNRVVIEGDEPLLQKEEIVKLIKKSEKFNPNIIFDIFTNGTIRPAGITNLKNIIFNVNIQLKNSEIEFKNRIKSSVINWFNEVESNFLFYIKNTDDVDEAVLLVQEYGIKKSNIFLFMGDNISKSNLVLLIQFCKRTGYNFALDYKSLFWEEEEK